MSKDPVLLAIQSAINGDWEKAIHYNKLALENDKEDVDAWNRLSKAYFETGNPDNAKSANEKALRLDPDNSIALKMHARLKRIKEPIVRQNKTLSAGAFIEEPGKTKIIKLINVSSDKNLAHLDSGDTLNIATNGHRIAINTKDGKYIGRLPDDISARLRELISLGNNYAVFVKTIEDKDVEVLIRETKRSSKIANIPSFTTDKVEYISFSSSKDESN